MTTSGSSDDRARAGYDATLYDQIAPGYYDKVFERGRGVQWFWHYERYAAVAANVPADGDSILDLGCGPGTFLGNYAAGFRAALGVDVAQPQIQYANSKYANDRVQFEATDAVGFAGKRRFDVVISIEVIEHLPSDETQAFLRTIFALLNPGGTVVLATPNYSSLWPIIEWFVSKIGPVNYLDQHINRFTLKSLAKELEKAGFKVMSKRTIFVISPFLASISAKLARFVYRLEQQLLPAWGAEIVMSARRPAETKTE